MVVVNAIQMIHGFSQKIAVALDFQDFEVRTARSADEVSEVLKLRYEIFFAELNAVSLGEDMDIDAFDLLADHLLLIDKKSSKIVGTYRFLCSTFTERFYSQTEFDMSNVLALDGIKLELGRACIHPAYRNSVAIELLWKGMTTYFAACGARYMFGCSSVEGHLEPYYAIIHQYLLKHHVVSAERMVYPQQETPLWVSLDATLDEASERRAARMVPTLLNGYLRAGSRIGGTPFWDPVFNTLDYFTLFDEHEITERYGRKYNLG